MRKPVDAEKQQSQVDPTSRGQFKTALSMDRFKPSSFQSSLYKLLVHVRCYSE